jgi:hypothetical protein
MTATLAPALLELTNDRDAVAVDVNGDNWLDFVTVPTTGGVVAPLGFRKPRVYFNLGNDGGGVWLGFDHVAAAMPTFDPAPGFCEAGAGDLDGLNGPDIFFVDYSGRYTTGDLNDRLVMNDGMGFFTDETLARGIWNAFPQDASSFGHCADILDMNNDTFPDIVREKSQGGDGNNIRIAYNDGTGNFSSAMTDQVYSTAAYFFVITDLDNDTDPDMYMADDGSDRYMINTGLDGSNMVNFTTFVLSSSDSPNTGNFGGSMHSADLDKDGFLDILVSDADVDLSGCARRAAILQNTGLGGSDALVDPYGGTADVEKNGTFDMVPIDINGDTWLDLVIGTCNGTHVYMNVPPADMLFTFPLGMPTELTPGVETEIQFSVEGVGVDAQPGTGVLWYKRNDDPWASVNATELSPNEYTAMLPAFDCGTEVRYSMAVRNLSNTVFQSPFGAPNEPQQAFAADVSSVLLEDKFDTDTGWEVTNDPSLSGGAWIRAVPVESILPGDVIAQPGLDYNVGDTMCYVTGNGSDVDMGPTRLLSPLFDLTDADGHVSFRFWHHSSFGSLDNLNVWVRTDATGWILVNSISTQSLNPDLWNRFSFVVSDYVTPGPGTRVRFVIGDSPDNSFTEAAIDMFRMTKFECPTCVPGDANGNGSTGADDVPDFVTALVNDIPASSNCGADVNGDGVIDAIDIQEMIDLLIP